MNIKDYRLSGLHPNEVVKLIEENECTIFIAERNRFGDTVINVKDGVSTCGTFTNGKCIQYDGVPVIPLNSINSAENYQHHFICKKEESEQVYKLIKDWVKKREEVEDRLVLRLLVYGVLSDVDPNEVVSEIDGFIDKVDVDDMSLVKIDALYREIVDKFNRK